MRTVIFIRGAIFEAAEWIARGLGMSRSEIDAAAAWEFLERHSAEKVTERLNEIYAAGHAASALDEGLQALQAASLAREDTW